MRDWLIGLGIAVGVMVVSWLVLILLARRLPEGTAEGAGAVPAGLRHHRAAAAQQPGRPPAGKLAVGFAGLWVLSPIDLIPEFLPVIGPLDDVVVVALAFRYAARQVPRDVLLDAWPGDRRIIERLIGPALARGPLTQGVVSASWLETHALEDRATGGSASTWR